VAPLCHTHHNLPGRLTPYVLPYWCFQHGLWNHFCFVRYVRLEWLKSPEIPVRGKHLDDLRFMDTVCIGFSKANTGPFTYFYLRYCWMNLPWHWREITVTNTLLPLPFLFILFDATYALMHGVLHWQCLYPYIHKHHHVQKAPSRANIDAVNVHPIEFLLGEYNHWLVMYVWTSHFRLPLHVGAAFAFLVVGGILAGINHTRFDMVVSVPVPRFFLRALSGNKSTAPSKTVESQVDTVETFWTTMPIYDSKAHDVHHRIPQSKCVLFTVALWRGPLSLALVLTGPRLLPFAYLIAATDSTQCFGMLFLDPTGRSCATRDCRILLDAASNQHRSNTPPVVLFSFSFA
jgi:sterol desaturase/sphingolipid hydroxylase (fatty acid hydroxylase superfamily)